ncbi:gamma-glutamyl-gamma-aminobutyrate hydrolase family protein [Mariniblastus sp.]|nr:gamma-glutamyl-gamma-aminobutyrate hydrolase family protein [Mariniblastus sp.]
MHTKPLIGINADYRTAEGKQPSFSVVTAGYYDSILKAGGIPVIVPPMTEEDDIQAVLDKLDGFVLVGGADLDPRKDGFMLHTSVRPMSSRRENFDRKLMQAIADMRLPVFGIGVGMQLINVTMHGNLFLNINDDVPNAIPHRDPLDPAHRHGLEVVSDSLMGRVYGDGEIRVSSRHHMAIDEVAPGFQVTARCPDGIIEAIESDMPDWIAIGTQFHPENDAASALDLRIFEEFLDLVREPVGADLRVAA